MSLGISNLIFKFSLICLALTAILSGWGCPTMLNRDYVEGDILSITPVEVYLTAKDTDDRLSLQPAAFFRNSLGKQASITIDPAMRFQEIVGFGGAFTESAAYALSQLTDDKRRQVLTAYFDPNEGLGYTLCRTHINSCDFSLDNYSYTAGIEDAELKNFSVQRDKNLLIPLIKDAVEISGGKIRLLASP